MYVYNGATWDEVGFTVAHDVPAGGATGTLLSKASATDYDTSWLAQSALTIAPSQVTGTALVATTADAKGDLYVASAADTVGRLAVGADGTVPYADSSASSGLSYRRPGWAAIPVGNYWMAGRYSAASSLLNTAGQAIVFPFYVPFAMTISDISIYIASAATAGQTQRLAIYGPNADGYGSGALIADCGTVAVDTTGRKAITGLSVALPAGLCWGAIISVGSPATAGTLYCGIANLHPSSTNVLSSVTSSWTATGMNPPLATLATSTTTYASVTPIFEFKRSA